MSYSWIGPPTPFNGTNLWTGGDSSMHQPNSFSLAVKHMLLPYLCIPTAEGPAMNMLTFSPSHHKPQSMVPVGRSSLHSRGVSYGIAHDPGTRLPVLRSCTAKIRSEYDLGMHGLILGHYLPMVLLGLLPRVFEYRLWLHWRSSPLWPSEHIGGTESRISAYS